jgi:DNA repair protein RadC
MKTYKSNLPQITLKLKKGEELNCKITSSKDAADLFRKVWDNDSLLIYESMICIFLNRQNNTIGWFKMSQGGLSGTLMDNRLILATALNCLAQGIIICHNHPSGNLTPSEADTKLTKKLEEAGKIMDINLLDSLILTETDHFSYADNGLINN